MATDPTDEPGGDEQDELDPQVLADPLGDDSDDGEPADAGDAAPAGDAAGDGAAAGSSTALVPAAETALAPADPFRRYMAEVRQYPPLSREDEQALARRYRETGDREALFRLVTANLMMVVRVALSFRRAARNLLDLIQEGNLGLLAAIERFDPELGVRLPTYAAWWVRAYMIKFLLDNVRLVRVGTTNARRKLLRNLRKEKARLEALGYETDTKLLADHFGVSETDVTDVQAALDSPRRVVRRAARRGPDVAGGRAAGERGQRRGAGRPPGAAGGRGGRPRPVPRRPQRARPVPLERADRVRGAPDAPADRDRFGTSREAVRQAEVRLMKRLEEHMREHLGADGSVRVDPGT